MAGSHHIPNHTRCRWWTLLIIIFPLSATANNPVIIQAGDQQIPVGPHLMILEDPHANLDLEQVLAIEETPRWTPSNSATTSLGITHSAYWFSTVITHSSALDRSWLMEIDYAHLNDVRIFTVTASGVAELIFEGGSLRPFEQRLIFHRNLAIPLMLPRNEPIRIILRAETSGPMYMPLTLWTAEAFHSHDTIRTLTMGLYYGIMLVMALYNLFIFVSIRDKSYLHYVLFVALLGLYQVSADGFGYQYLWPNSPSWNNVSETVTAMLGLGFGCFFTTTLLNFGQQNPSFHRLLMTVGIVSIAIVLLVPVVPKRNLEPIINIFIPVLALANLGAGLSSWARGNVLGTYYTVAIFGAVAGGIAIILADTGIVARSLWTTYGPALGLTAQVVLLSFALAHKVKLMDRERLAAEQRAITLKEHTQAAALALQTQVAAELQSEVAKQTSKLRQKNQDLVTALQEVETNQAMLIQSEKMSSLGALVASVAHEINNPINYVTNGIVQVIDRVRELRTVIDEIAPEGDQGEKFHKLFQPTFEDLEAKFPHLEDGAKRIRGIVTSLKKFSRQDEVATEHVDLREGISSTIVLLGRKLDNIEVTRNDGAIPLVTCKPAEINQVIMNLCANGAEAMLHGSVESPKLTIATTLGADNYVNIEVQDNGPGISPEVQKRIFEPFFTTKEVGEGTGLGLSICYKIIEGHGGTINLETGGWGTKFIVRLPAEVLERQ